MAKEPVLLSKWYAYAKWLLERVENIPKSQRFVLGQRLADGSMDVMELLVEAAYTRDKKPLLQEANRNAIFPVHRSILSNSCIRACRERGQCRFLLTF